MTNQEPLRVSRLIGILGAYFAATWLGGALLAPCNYWLVQQIPSTAAKYGQMPFERFVHRSVLIFAILGILPMMWALGLRSRQELGLTNPRLHWRNFMAGLALGFLVSAVICCVLIAVDARALNPNLTAKKLAWGFGIAIGTALVVAFIEEVLFRGLLFGAIRKALSWPVAALVSSLIFAGLHFLQRVHHTGEVTAFSGVYLLPGMWSGLFDVDRLIPKFISLTLVGFLLAFAYQRSGSLYLSIGLHAGGVFWILFMKTLTVPVAGASISLWGSSFVYDGWLGVAVLLLALFAAPHLLSAFGLGRTPEAALSR